MRQLVVLAFDVDRDDIAIEVAVEGMGEMPAGMAPTPQVVPLMGWRPDTGQGALCPLPGTEAAG